MSINFAIIGGDRRIVELAKILAKEENKVYIYGLEESSELNNIENIISCNSIEQAIKDAKIVIGPIPFSSDGKNINTPFSKKIIYSWKYKKRNI